VGSMSKANGSHSYVFGSFSESKGIHSYVIGSNSEAKTLYSFTIGVGSKSMSTSSMAIGNFVEAYGQSSIVLGMGSYQSELVHNIPHSLAVGFGSTIPTFFVGGSPSTTGTGNVGIATTDPQAKLHVNGDFQVGDVENHQEIRLYGSINAEGEYATAFGYDNAASGNFSFAGGELSEASGRSSFSFGQGNTVFHNYSFALGRFLEVHGSSSYAIGRYLKTLNPESMVIGYGFSDTQTLNNNIPRSLMIGFESTKPTFFVGPSNGANNTGKVGIGNVTDPQAKLHIRADDGMIPEHATLRLEATAANTYARIYLGDAHHITAANQQNMKFSLPADRSFIFENGSVGIGTDAPEAKLHISGGDVYLEDINFGIIMKSPNGHCWRGVMTDNGTLSFSQANCPGEAAAIGETSPANAQFRLFPNPATKSVNIEFSAVSRNSALAIFSTDGGFVTRIPVNSMHMEVSLSGYKSGAYIVQYEQNGIVVSSEKLLVQ
jgi:hypothetical protein